MIYIKEIQESDMPINTELCKKGTKTKKIYLKQSDLPEPSLPPYIEEQIFAKNDKEQVSFKSIREGFHNLYAIIKNNNIIIEEKIIKQIFTTGDSEDNRIENICTCIIETDEPVEILYNTEKYIYCIPYIPEIPTVDKLPTSATLTEAVNKNIEVKNKIDACKDKLAYILTNKNLPSTKEEKITELIDKVNNLNENEPKPKIYGVKVMENNSNPDSCCTYIEDAIGVKPANSTSLGGWADKWPFDKIRIVGFKNGQVTKEINPNNKKQYKDGSSVPTDVDVMVEIPKVYWKFTNISNGYELRISNTKIEGSDCYAHKVGGVEKDFIYVGAYLGSVETGRLRSKSGVTPTTNITLTNFRSYANNVGNGYQQFNWFTLMLLQNLYLLAYKNLNSQTALGYGYANGNSGKTNTGGTNTKGMIFGETGGKQQVCFLGIEDFYGNIWQWVDGMFHNGSYQVTVTPDNKTFNDNGSGFKNVGKFISSGTEGYASKVAHTNEGGFFPMEASGSETTYYCDYGLVNPGYFGYCGGYWNDKLSAGAFRLRVNYYASNSNYNIGSRLVFLG